MLWCALVGDFGSQGAKARRREEGSRAMRRGLSQALPRLRRLQPHTACAPRLHTWRQRTAGDRAVRQHRIALASWLSVLRLIMLAVVLGASGLDWGQRIFID